MRIVFRATEEFKSSVRNEIKKEGYKGISDYFRRLHYSNKSKAKLAAIRDVSLSLEQARKDMLRIGINLNQIARAVNSDREISDVNLFDYLNGLSNNINDLTLYLDQLYSMVKENE